MIVDKHNGSFDLICNGCGSSHLVFTEDFIEVVETANEDGYKSTKSNGEWENFCELCRGFEGI